MFMTLPSHATLWVALAACHSPDPDRLVGRDFDVLVIDKPGGDSGNTSFL